MRKILFKAKLKNWKDIPIELQWVEGSLLVLDWDSDYVYIMKEVNRASTLPISLLIDRNCFLIDKETICQYICMNGKDGKMIWENDVFEFEAYGRKYIGYVKIIKGNTALICKNASPFLDDVLEKWNPEKIGNIIDNPELLERS